MQRVSEEQLREGQECLMRCTVYPSGIIRDMETEAASWLRRFAIALVADQMDARARIAALEAALREQLDGHDCDEHCPLCARHRALASDQEAADAGR